MSVKVLKLSTGQDIIAETRFGDDGKIFLRNPMLLALTEKFTYMMLPGFLPLAKRDPQGHVEHEMNTQHVICHDDVDERTRNAYAEQTGGVVTPNKSLVLP